MFKLEHAITQWRDRLSWRAGVEAADLDEMESHLRDEVDARVAAGDRERDAFFHAASAFGSDEELSLRFRWVLWESWLADTVWSSPQLLCNYLKVACRSLRKHRVYSFVSILGLAIGLTSVLLVATYVDHEWRFEQVHEDHSRIVRLLRSSTTSAGETTYHGGSTSGMAAPTLLAEVPDVERVVRISLADHAVHQDGKKQIYRVALTDPEVLEVFTFPFLSGDPETALLDPSGMLMTRRAATRLFGASDPMGQTILLVDAATNKDRRYTVTGILGDIPATTHLQFELLTAGRTSMFAEAWKQWRVRRGWLQTFALLRPNQTRTTIESKVHDVLEKRAPRDADTDLSFYLQPLTRIRLFSQTDYGFTSMRTDAGFESLRIGPLELVYAIVAIACLILLTAAVNFVALAASRSADRRHEIILRRAIGASRGRLVQQLLGEALVIAGVAFVLALGLTHLLLPTFSSFSGRVLTLHGDTLLLVGCLTIGLGLLAGVYPAILATGRALAAGEGRSDAGGRTRRLFVVAQFGLAIVVGACTWTAARQMHFVDTANLGRTADNMLGIRVFHGKGARARYQTIKQMFLGDPNVLAATASRGGHGLAGPTVVRADDSDRSHDMMWINADEDCLDTFGIDLLAGRTFAGADEPDSACLLNEVAVQRLGWAEPIGRSIEPLGPGNGWATVIGVVRDFHVGSMHEKIPPVVMLRSPRRFNILWLRLKPGDLAAAVRSVDETFAQLYPEDIPDRLFMRDVIEEQYFTEYRMLGVLAGFSVIAVLISCMGLFGLVFYSAQRRAHEIGVRRVLGARILDVLLLLSVDFLRLVCVANLLALPIALWLMRDWLQQFAYHVDLSLQSFLMCGLLSLAVSLVPLTWQSWRAATSNPVAVLRDE
jgi:putative ABC transport system permease protein